MDFFRAWPSLADVFDQYISVRKKFQLFQSPISWRFRNSHAWKDLMMIDDTDDGDEDDDDNDNDDDSEDDDVPLHKNVNFLLKRKGTSTFGGLYRGHSPHKPGRCHWSMKKSQLFQAAISWRLPNSHALKDLMMIDYTDDDDDDDDDDYTDDDDD